MREIIFEKGELYKALRATMSLPLVFEPARIEDMMLLDGAVLDNTLVEIAEKLSKKKQFLLISIGLSKKSLEIKSKTPSNLYKE